MWSTFRSLLHNSTAQDHEPRLHRTTYVDRIESVNQHIRPPPPLSLSVTTTIQK